MLAVAVLGLAVAARPVRPCAAAAGDLDPGFGDQGLVVSELSDGVDMTAALALQPDGKLVVAGRSLPRAAAVDGVALARYLPDGSLDASFGRDGTVREALLGRSGYVRDVAVASDGRIVAAGAVYVGALGRHARIEDLAVMRFLPDGGFDGTFGEAGVTTIHFGERVSVAEAVIAMPDGRIVAAGRTYDAALGNDRSIVVRLNEDGTADRSFGADGVVILGHPSGSWGAALQPDGRVVLVGSTSNPATTPQLDVVMVRLLVDGTLDASFGQGGYVVVDLDGRGDQGRSVAVLEDGSIVVSAYVMAESGDQVDLALARFDASGHGDGAFGRAGVATVVSGRHRCVDGPGLAVQPDGGLLVAGESGFGVARFDRSGRVDPAFAPDRLHFGGEGGLACAVDVAVQPDGAVVVAGTQYFDNNQRARFMVARFEGQSPTLSGQADRPAPLAGEPVLFTLEIANSGYVAFRDGGLSMTVPVELAAAGRVEIIPTSGGRAGAAPFAVDDICLVPGGVVTVTVPTRVRDDVPPGTPLSVEAVLEPGRGHNPISTTVRLVTQGPPVAMPDFALTARDTPVRIAVVSNDRDPNGDHFLLVGVSEPDWGVTTFEAAGVVTYTPSAGYVGRDSFRYEVRDVVGLSASGTVTVMVAERLYPLFLPFAAQPGLR